MTSYARRIITGRKFIEGNTQAIQKNVETWDVAKQTWTSRAMFSAAVVARESG